MKRHTKSVIQFRGQRRTRKSQSESSSVEVLVEMPTSAPYAWICTSHNEDLHVTPRHFHQGVLDACNNGLGQIKIQYTSTKRGERGSIRYRTEVHDLLSMEMITTWVLSSHHDELKTCLKGKHTAHHHSLD